jgi:hypothetical protein
MAGLLELRPQESRLKLGSLKQELVLRPITLADEAWLDETYGSEEITKVFEEVNIKEISRIVFRLLRTDSKKLFKKQTVEIVDENGNCEDIELGGLDLLRTMIVGWPEKIALYNCLLDNIGISRPELDEPVKKNKMEAETVEMKL